MKTSHLTLLIGLIVVIGGIYYLFTRPSATETQTPSQTSVSQQTATTTQPTQTSMSATVIYGPNGFSPATVTIAKGSKVTFVNQSGNEMWLASDPHPTHQGYDGTTKNVHCASGYAGAAPFDQCSTGDSFSFTFDKSGTWGYHNHANDSDEGTVIVQ